MEGFNDPNVRATGALALCCAVAGVALAGCDEAPDADSAHRTEKIKVGDRSVNVSCSGEPVEGRPVVVLLHGGGDGLDKLAGLQKTLAEKDRVCSYDRLGAGASDQPDGPQTFETTGKVLTAVHRPGRRGQAGGAGRAFAGRADRRPVHPRPPGPGQGPRPDGRHLPDPDRRPPGGDTGSATGTAAELRAQTLAVLQGDGPEKLATPDGAVRPAGDIPVEVIQHGKPYLAALPEYGPALEQAWAEGQKKWLAISSHSTLTTATDSEHYIYVDQPELAVQAIQRVVLQATPVR